MSLLSSLQRDLQEASEAEARAARTIIAHPDVPSVHATLLTIQKRRENLEEQFLAAANEVGLDVCSYRIEYDVSRRPTISGVTAALNLFQRTFTTVYDALINGPKKIAKLGSDVIDATALEFAYTFPGSVGVMMMLPNDRLLLGGTNLDDAMRTTLQLISPHAAEQIQALTHTVGLPAVRLAHQWAAENSKAGFGADISWRRQENEKFELRVQPQEVRDLAYALGSAIAQEQVQVVGDLLDVRLSDLTFQMRVDGKVISGSFTKAISEANPAQVPKRYLVTLNVQTRIAVADEGEDVSYILVRLDQVEPNPLALSVFSPL